MKKETMWDRVDDELSIFLSNYGPFKESPNWYKMKLPCNIALVRDKILCITNAYLQDLKKEIGAA